MALQLNTDEYTNYIDSSEMIIEYYKHQTTTGLEKYFLEIEDWLAKDVQPHNNKPLIIEAEEGIGKKTLVVKWMDYHQANSKKFVKDLIIPNFAGTGGNNSNYYYAIYRILTKLRETFDIKQKVELLEQKLRKYFHYWLDVASRIIHEQVVNDQFVILVFESLNYYMEFETDEEANVAMWLPKTFPKNVRVIVTVDPNAKALENLRDQGCDVIKINSEPSVIQNQISNHLNKQLFIDDDASKKKLLEILNNSPAKNQSLFVKIYLSTLLPYPIDKIVGLQDIDLQEFKKLYANLDFERLKSIHNVADLNEFLLDFYADKITKPEIFRNVLSLLTITQKGLTTAELFVSSKITQQDWNKLLAVFKTFFMKYQNYWKINNEPFKKSIYAKYLSNQTYRVKLHNDVSEVLQKTPNSIRKLEEQTYHLFGGESYFKLKEAISNIENFLLLFNPNNKYQLCRYWEKLELKGFDPACEYNKAVESFIMHYKPSSDDTFSIILQISRFLKEFSDFETELTPDFRHPLIKGSDELYDIGLLQEIVKLDMYLPEDWALSKINIGEFKDVVSDEEEVDNQAQLAVLSPKEKREKRDESLKRLFSKAKVRIEKNLALLNSNDEGAKHEVTHKKITTLLGQPSTLPLDPVLPSKAGGKEEDNKRDHRKKVDTAKNQFQLPKLQYQTGAVTSPRAKPKYLEPQKKGAFDLYFETLNVEIEENKGLLRMMYMLMGGLIDDADVNPNVAKKKSNYILDDETKPKPGRDLFDNEEAAKTQRGFDAQRDRLEQLREQFLKIFAHQAENHQILVSNSKIVVGGERAPLYYYYKRWLWMMFPWICVSPGLCFSKIMKACFSSVTRYMSVKKEREYTEQALKIAIEAKLKKRAVYAKADSSNEGTMVKSNLGESKILASIQSKRKIQDVSQYSNNMSKSQAKNESGDKSRTLGPGLVLDSLSPINADIKPFLSAKSQKNNESHFFITNEILNLGYLNNNTTRDSAKDNFSKARQDTSSQSILVTNKSKERAQNANNNIITDKIAGALQDKVLLAKPIDRQRGNISNLQGAYGNKKANNSTAYLDVNASTVLPKLSQSLTLHSAKGLQTVQIKVDTLIDGYNETVYKNQQLARKLKDLKLQKLSLTGASEEHPIETANKKIAELERRVRNAENMLEETKEEERRLTTLIGVCLRNKMQNEAWVRDLNYILANIRKMIIWERQSIEKHTLETAEIKKYFMNLYRAVQEKIDNHEQFIQHVKRELHAKDKLARQLLNVDGDLETSAFLMYEKLKDTFGKANTIKEEKKKLVLLERNNRNIQENLEFLEHEYEKIAPIVETAENYSQSPQFQSFIDGLEKRNDLEMTAFERQTRIAKLKDQLERKEAYIQTLKKATLMSKKNRFEVDVTNDSFEAKIKEQQAKKLKQIEELSRVNQTHAQTILEARYSFKSITQKLEIIFNYDEKELKSIPYNEIIAKFEDCMNYLKENLPAEKYEQLNQGNFDMDQFFKESYPVDGLISVTEERKITVEDK